MKHPQIMEAVRTSDIVLICLSKNSINKEGYVQKEIKKALDVAEEKPEGTVYIIPLRLEECDIPRGLRRWQYVDIFQREGYEKLMKSFYERANTLKIAYNLAPTLPFKCDTIINKPELDNTHDQIRESQQELREIQQKPQWLNMLSSIYTSLNQIIQNNFYIPDTRIIIRDQRVQDFVHHAEYLVNFSIVNRRDSPIALNSVTFRIGDYTSESEGPPPLMYVVFKKIEVERALLHKSGKR